MRTKALSRTAAERRAHLLRELVEVLLFVGIAFAAISVTRGYTPVDSSMAPSAQLGLQEDQRVLVNRAAYIIGGPARGDIALIANPQNPSQVLLRRIIAVPGDTIVITASTVTLNGAALNETDYTSIPRGQPESPIIGKYVLGPGQYFVMCDNRLGSLADSRSFGPLPRQNIIGRAEFVYWPLRQFHWIQNDSNVFSSVPSH